MAVLSSAMVRRQAKILSGNCYHFQVCFSHLHSFVRPGEKSRRQFFHGPLPPCGTRNYFDQEYTMKIHGKTDETIVYNMKPSLHLRNQCFCTTKCRWAFLNPSSLFAIVLKVDNFSKTPSKGHLQRYSDFKTKRIRNHFPFTGRFSFFKTNPPP